MRGLRANLTRFKTPSRRHYITTGTNDTPRLLRSLLYGPALAVGLVFSYLYITDTRASVHQSLVVPLIRYLYPDAEDAHKLGNDTLKTLYALGLHPRERGGSSSSETPDLSVRVFGHVLDNPIGTSAGIDKNAEIPDPLLCLGPGVVEVGGVTPFEQTGNPKPRVWRIPSQNAIINRYGLNSQGADAVARRLRERVRAYAYNAGLGIDSDAERYVLDGQAGMPPGSLTPGRLLAVQVAKMKTTPGDDIDAVARDYVYCVDRLARYADIMVVNVSSPNTPGLRNLQQTAPLTKILTAVVASARAADRRTKPAVMVKVSPDEDSDVQVQGIVDAVWASGVDGIIVGNTTMKRPDPLPRGFALPSQDAKIMLEQGGYSGPQLFDRTVSLVSKYKRFLDKRPDKEKVIFATGGITNGKQALEVLNAGASVAMVYTALVYGGAGTITRIKSEMRDEMQKRR